MTTGDHGSPGGGTTTVATRLVAGLWGWLGVDPGAGGTPPFEITPAPVGSCREWDYAGTVANTNDNGYGIVTDPVIPPITPVGVVVDGATSTVLPGDVEA